MMTYEQFWKQTNAERAAMWPKLSTFERDKLRDTSGLCKQLLPFESDRVEVVDRHGETRRFIVSRSTGWKPCSLEIKTTRSMGGDPAPHDGYKSVRFVAHVRR